MAIMPDRMLCHYEDCGKPISSVVQVKLCDHHAIKVYRAMRDTLAEHEDAKPMAFHGSGRAMLNYSQRGGLVYFIRFGDRIKIGFTTDLKRRLQVLPHDMLLATTPGTMRDEGRLHQRFAHLRITGEWFHAAPDLLAYIAALDDAA